MRLGREMHDDIAFRDKRRDHIRIRDASLDETIACITLPALQIFQISRVRQSIQIDNLILRIFRENMMDEIRTDKPRTASD
jgi:hypothetical protein